MCIRDRPSTLTAFQMQQIFSAVRDTFVVEENAEITVEMNPGTVDLSLIHI